MVKDGIKMSLSIRIMIDYFDLVGSVHGLFCFMDMTNGVSDQLMTDYFDLASTLVKHTLNPVPNQRDHQLVHDVSTDEISTTRECETENSSLCVCIS